MTSDSRESEGLGTFDPIEVIVALAEQELSTGKYQYPANKQLRRGVEAVRSLSTAAAQQRQEIADQAATIERLERERDEAQQIQKVIQELLAQPQISRNIAHRVLKGDNRPCPRAK